MTYCDFVVQSLPISNRLRISEAKKRAEIFPWVSKWFIAIPLCSATKIINLFKSLSLDDFPKGWNNRIDEELRQYKQEILEKGEKVSEKEIIEIMNDIVGLDYVMKLDLINKLKKDNSDNIL